MNCYLSSDTDGVGEANEPDPATWKLLELRAPKRDGSWAEITLLEPPEWLAQQQVRVGGTVRIDVPECGIEGQARVLAIGPCPAITPGKGPVVTGTFKHVSAQVLDLYVEGLDAPIGVTANHRFWSEDRRDWVPAGQLRPGERLRRLKGKQRAVKMVPRTGQQPV